MSMSKEKFYSLDYPKEFKYTDGNDESWIRLEGEVEDLDCFANFIQQSRSLKDNGITCVHLRTYPDSLQQLHKVHKNSSYLPSPYGGLYVFIFNNKLIKNLELKIIKHAYDYDFVNIVYHWNIDKCWSMNNCLDSFWFNSVDRKANDDFIKELAEEVRQRVFIPIDKNFIHYVRGGTAYQTFPYGNSQKTMDKL